MLQVMSRSAWCMVWAALSAQAFMPGAGGRLLLLSAQSPAPAGTRRPQGDSLSRADTAKRATLPPIEVRVTRAAEDHARLPMAVGVLGDAALRRGQLTTGLDESLSRLPGVVVLNRYNY